MDSIAQGDGLEQVAQGPHIRVMEYGIMDSTIKQSIQGRNGNGKTPAAIAPRGQITGFSAGSRRRLRETLLSKHVQDAVCLGCTFTVPWNPVNCDSKSRFLAEFKSFRYRFERRFPNSAIIWRIELQQRKAPHLHGVAYVARADIGDGYPDGVIGGAVAATIVADLWHKSVDISDVAKYRAFFSHGVKVEQMDASDKLPLLRYLCDHTSKRKQAQIGWQGRQWGVIGLKNLVPFATQKLQFDSELHRAIFNRIRARLDAHRVTDARSVFGCYYRPSRRRFGVHFLPGGGKSAIQAYEIARKLAAEKIKDRTILLPRRG